MNNTQQTQVSVSALPGSGQALYDRLMSQIELDLTTSQLPILSSKYSGETGEGRKLRAERYAKAFRTYDIASAAYLSAYRRNLRDTSATAIRVLEEKERATSQHALETIHEMMNQSSPISL